MDHRPLALVTEYRKTLTGYNKVLSHTTGPFTVKDVKNHVITAGVDGIPNTKSIDRDTPVSNKAQETTRITAGLGQSVRTTVPHYTDTERSWPSEYVADRVVDHHRASKDLEYNIRLCGYTPEEDTWKPESHITCHFISQY